MTKALTTKVNLEDVPFAEGLREEEGWFEMLVQFAVSEESSGAHEVVFGRTIFRPGSRHEWHRHENAEEVQYLLSGEGVVLDGEDNLISVGPGDIVFTPKNRWHGFRNTSETEDAVLIWMWAGAGSREEAGYEARVDADS